ncbi:MAG: T9SS type A sorting domain-containing protein [Bacteroidota bacterium]
MKKIFFTSVLFYCVYLSVLPGANAQSLVPVGNTSFPVNDNHSAATGAALNTGWQINGIGKIVVIVKHPSILTKLYACSASGGIFVSTNSGTSWTPLTGSFLPGVQFGCLSIDPANVNIMYAGTGEPSYAQTYGWGGLGTFKSLDGGVTWTQTNTGMGNVVVQDILVNPLNTQEVIACTSVGIYKSVNAGGSWILASSGSWVQQVLRQGSGNILVAISNDRFLRSVDFGGTWTVSDLDPAFSATFTKGRIAVAPTNSSIVYAGWVYDDFFTSNNACIFYSTDGGVSFTKKYAFANTPKLISYDGSSAAGYGWANFFITVSNTDPNTLFTGGHLIFKSVNNGTNWTATIPNWWCCIHTDIHQLLYDPNNSTRILAATDGGVFVSTDGAVNWTPLSNGLYCNQYLSMGQSNMDPEFVIGGLQDNGIIYKNTDGNYHTYTGGDYYDHMTCDYTNNYNVYTSGSNGKVFNPYNRSQKSNLNLPSNILTTGTANSRQSFIISPLNPAIGYGWGTNIYRSSNVNSYNLAAGTSTVSWSMIGAIGVNIRDLKISPANNDIVYALGSNATVYKSVNATAVTPAFVPLVLPDGASTSVNGSLTVSALNPNVLYATANNAVYRSTDAGTTWTNYTATGLPAINFQKVFIDPYSTIESVYLITSLGVYYRDLTMTAWTSVNPSVPPGQQNSSASYAGLILGPNLYKGSSSSTSHVSFATWGSGIWKSTFYNQAINPLPAGFANVDIGSPAIAGSASFDNAKQAFNVSGAGSGINSTSTDQFNFTRTLLTGNGDVFAKIYSVAETDAVTGLSKTGLMLRASENSNAPYVMVALTGHAGAVFQYRINASDAATINTVLPAPAPAYPYWVKINKNGNLITASTSPDGVSWTGAGQVTVNLGTNFWGGIVNTSNNIAAVNRAAVGNITLNSFGVLAIQNLKLQAVVKDKDKVGLSWSFETDEKNNTIILERSVDGVNFTAIHRRNYPNLTGFMQSYNDAATDEIPFKGRNFYRIKMVQQNGDIKYSTVQSVAITKGLLIKVEPNPVSQNGMLNFIISGDITTKPSLDIYDMTGRKLQSQLLSGSGINVVKLKNFTPGTYNYRIMFDGETMSGKFIVSDN